MAFTLLIDPPAATKRIYQAIDELQSSPALIAVTGISADRHLITVVPNLNKQLASTVRKGDFDSVITIQGIRREFADYKCDKVIVFCKAPAGKYLPDLLSRVADLSGLGSQLTCERELYVGQPIAQLPRSASAHWRAA